ncbi:hypothetical protein HMPREF0027_0498 [Actinobacillus ureae ATCC 25976]|uniref:Uncharacterized protein n=1 Tax=Actinobacillus ureae ATCC 25976 TaxID=887324 RepID=E8KF81_9PAST|nr:hypothetical protein HMPREF0027_0498 [Actinobacillus ureae ATCC 25976]
MTACYNRLINVTKRSSCFFASCFWASIFLHFHGWCSQCR